MRGTSPRGRERFESESEREGGSEMRGKEGASRASIGTKEMGKKSGLRPWRELAFF